jgi:hypothetical protein
VSTEEQKNRETKEQGNNGIIDQGKLEVGPFNSKQNENGIV